MASIIVEAVVHAPADEVWRALSNAGEAHRIFSAVLSDCRLESEDTRVVTFANGLVVTERIVGIDAALRRIAYSVTNGDFSHHAAAMQVFAEDNGTSRFVWTCDVLPDAATERIHPLMLAGTAAPRRTFNGG